MNYTFSSTARCGFAALERLGRGTRVEANGVSISKAAAVLVDRSLRLAEHETALDVGWLP